MDFPGKKTIQDDHSIGDIIFVKKENKNWSLNNIQKLMEEF